MKRAGILLAAAIVAGCALGAREADRYLILETPASATPAATRGDVRAMPTTAAAFYDTQSIAFSREPGTRAYYQFNHWTERPQRAIQPRGWRHKRLRPNPPLPLGSRRLRRFSRS